MLLDLWRDGGGGAETARNCPGRLVDAALGTGTTGRQFCNFLERLCQAMGVCTSCAFELPLTRTGIISCVWWDRADGQAFTVDFRQQLELPLLFFSVQGARECEVKTDGPGQGNGIKDRGGADRVGTPG